MNRHCVLWVMLLSGSAPLAAQPESDPPPPVAAPKPAEGAATDPGPAPTLPPAVTKGQSATPPQAAASQPSAASASVSPAERDRIRLELLHEARELRAAREAREAAATRAERSPSDGIPKVTIAASLDTLFYADSGYDLFNEDDDLSTRLGLWAAYDIAQLSPRLTLAVELGGGGESHESFIWDGGIETQLDAITLTAGATLRYAWLPFLDPQLRVSGGASRISFELKTRDSRTFDDSAISGLGALGFGLLFHTPPRVFENRFGKFAWLSFGLLVEGGYALRSPVEPQLEGDSEPKAIPLTRASLGELGLSGPYLRTSLLARF